MHQPKPISPSEWSSDTAQCEICSTKFSLFNRRHHCRWCGRCICHACSNNQHRNERICKPCEISMPTLRKLMGGSASLLPTPRPASPRAAPFPSPRPVIAAQPLQPLLADVLIIPPSEIVMEEKKLGAGSFAAIKKGHWITLIWSSKSRHIV